MGGVEKLQLWIIFNSILLLVLAFDMAVLYKRPGKVGLMEGIIRTVFWISLAMAVNGGVYLFMGPQKALMFFTGYFLEKSLSVDNLFIFFFLFSYFGVPRAFQRKVLFMGMLGAIVLRALVIMAGISLLHHFTWMIYVFGSVLVAGGLRTAFLKKENILKPAHNLAYRLFHKTERISARFAEDRFVFREKGRIVFTPLLVVLIIVEISDIVFAMDSIPAALSITTDPFIVYSSNVLAVFGLRSLYFVLSEVMERFYYLRYGIAAILVFTGGKMLLSHLYTIPVGYALLVIAGVFVTAAMVSLFKSRPALT
ncbi:MAG: TerC/Alx family metal homeostasis membrane protein [bacterium]